MLNKSIFSLNEDQRWALADVALVAAGLESVSPAELVEDGFKEKLDFERYDVLDYREARNGQPAALLCEVQYGAHLKCRTSRRHYETVIPYKRRFEVFYSHDREELRKLRERHAHTSLEDKDGNSLVPAEIEESITAEECGLPQDMPFHTAVYVQPTLQATGERFSDLRSFGALLAGPIILEHSDINETMREIVQPRSKHTLSSGKTSFLPNAHRGGVDTSGRSGIWTIHAKSSYYYEGGFEDDGKFDVGRRYEVESVISIAHTREQKALLRHAAKWQKALGQDSEENERIPTPKIYVEPKPFYNSEEYVIQEGLGWGLEHFQAGVEHVAELGKALGRIHNRPANEAETPPVDSVLYSGGLIADCRKGLEAAKERSETGKKHGANPRMKTSVQGQLLERFSWEELQEKAPDLCVEAGLTKRIAEDFAKMRQRKAQQDERLPTGLCHGDMHPRNVLTCGKSHISILDFQGTGKGVFADELVLALYFFCADDNGKLDPERTRAFFGEYCKARCRDDKSTGNTPLTRQEIAVLPERIASLAKRQTHPVWVMFRNEKETLYSTFAERNHVLPEQMHAYTGPEGREKFAREFLGHELSELPEYRPSMVEIQRKRGMRNPCDSHARKIIPGTRSSGASGQFVGSGV